MIAPFVGASIFDDLVVDGFRLLVRAGIVDVDVGPADAPRWGWPTSCTSARSGSARSCSSCGS
ncbi:hypothetical protein ACFQRB_12060 [Halobaculum litoreum]|uniref:Uncharacterized protein n=1 Tax=Halobaculum litoreum TaxID=3031998 RepID=A0ABD5XUZ2_9EURY